MKKLLGILVLGLLWCNVVLADNHRGIDLKKDLTGKKIICMGHRDGGFIETVGFEFLSSSEVKIVEIEKTPIEFKVHTRKYEKKDHIEIGLQTNKTTVIKINAPQEGYFLEIFYGDWGGIKGDLVIWPWPLRPSCNLPFDSENKPPIPKDISSIEGKMYLDYIGFLRALQIHDIDIDLLSSENFKEYMKFLYDQINKRNNKINNE